MRDSTDSRGRSGRITTAYALVYPIPLRVVAGQDVTLGERDTEWPYVWCIDRAGTGGWVPVTYIQETGPDRGIVMRDFDTTELTVEEGEHVTVSAEEGGWLWCTNARGESGWVPAQNVEEE